MAVRVTALEVEPHDAKEEGETDKPICIELTDATSTKPPVLRLHMKESPRLPLLTEFVAANLIVA
jgi:hypothetical protein